RAGYPDQFLAVPRVKLATYHESSGTSTGRSTGSYLTEDDWSELVDRVSRHAVSLTAQDTVLVKIPYAMVTAAHQMHAVARAAGALVIPADSRSSAMPHRRILRLLRDLQVTVACCMPLEPLLWAACAQLWGEPQPHLLAPALRAIVCFSEPLAAAKRARIQSLWKGARVHESYGVSECGGNLGGECPAGHLHLWADRYLPEILDPVTGALTTEGTGQLVVTTLYREAMPLVRYNIGDLVTLRYQECTCGWHLPLLRVFGRAESAGSQTRTLRVTDVEDLVYSLPEQLGVLFWRGVLGGSGLRIEVEAEPSCAAQAVDELRTRALTQLGMPVEVSVVAPGTLVPLDVLTQDEQFAKPRYLYTDTEDLASGILYPPALGRPGR
ncbi:MAG TPA: AMP-binding protein, partial [Pseudonocardiaceae bacterium]|nr:AMP-binding protein [Pseudonocardiaceae bacterium]